MPDEIDLDEDDEAALDRAWEAVAKQDEERRKQRGKAKEGRTGHDIPKHERTEDPGPAA